MQPMILRERIISKNVVCFYYNEIIQVSKISFHLINRLKSSLASNHHPPANKGTNPPSARFKQIHHSRTNHSTSDLKNVFRCFEKKIKCIHFTGMRPTDR